MKGNITDLDQNSEALLVRSWGATRAGVLPVKIQTIKLVLTQESDHAANEGLTIGSRGNHGGEPDDRNTVRVLLPVHSSRWECWCSFQNYLLCSTKVPSSDGQQSLKVAVPASTNNINSHLIPAGVWMLYTNMCFLVRIHVYWLVLQGLELSIELLVIPLVGRNHVVVHASKGIDKMVTETWVNVGGKILSCSGTVLCPVSEITGQDVGWSCKMWNNYIMSPT